MAQVQLPPGVPDFESFVKERQAALIDRKKEKKRAGIPFWPNFAATKGAGVSAQIAATLASKMGMLALFAVVSAVAGGAGIMQRLQLQRKQDDFKKKQFQASLVRDTMLRKNAALKGSVPTIDGTRNDTIGFVKAGELAGPNAAEGAAAADAAAAAAAAKAGDGAAGGNGTNPGEAAPDAQDPNAMAAAMMAQAGAQGGAGAKGGAGANGYGKLSGGLGGMRGGGGMSGGVGRGFDQVNMKNSMLAKASAMKGGNEASIIGNKAKKGQLRNWAPSRRITSGVRSSASANRLRQMSADMGANKNGEVGKSAAANTAAWDASSAAGQSIQGAGAGIPTASPGSSASLPDPGPGEGGPIMGSETGIGDTDIGTNVPQIPDYENVTPYQWAIDLAKMLMIAITVLSLYIMAAKAFPSIASPAIIGACTTAVAIMGGVLAALGIYMLAMGQYMQGTIWTVLGGVVAVLALAAPVTSGTATPIIQGYAGAATAALAGAGGFAGEAMMKNNEAGIYDQSDHKDAYRKKYGVDPDTKQVINQDKFDKRYGDGATENWNDQRQYDDMR